ncbi:MAG: hypothetical protein LBB20_01930 [Puniceicoccales bacterium]|nr:hypothetical protein [Puniceicoccales bacterium]
MTWVSDGYGDYEPREYGDQNSPFVAKLGLTLYNTLGDGNCGYWAIAIGNDPEKGTYTREDMLKIRKIVHPDNPDDFNDGSLWLDIFNCMDIAPSIDKVIVGSGLDKNNPIMKVGPNTMGIYKVDPNTISIYTPDNVHGGIFVNGTDATGKPLVGVNCLKSFVDDIWLRGNKYELIETLYGNNVNAGDKVIEDFTEKFFNKWVNIDVAPPLPDDNEVPNVNAKKGKPLHAKLEQAWKDFFNHQITENSKLQDIVARPGAIFIHNVGDHWVVALNNKKKPVQPQISSIRPTLNSKISDYNSQSQKLESRMDDLPPNKQSSDNSLFLNQQHQPPSSVLSISNASSSVSSSQSTVNATHNRVKDRLTRAKNSKKKSRNKRKRSRNRKRKKK